MKPQLAPLIDTHCHWVASEFDHDRDTLVQQCDELAYMVVPSVLPCEFDAVIALHNQYPRCVYALGIHPLYVAQTDHTTLPQLEKYLAQSQAVAIGEIGLDYFVTRTNASTQRALFQAQLAIARSANLPVILHTRRAVDDVLYHLRRSHVAGGIAHAFNGSLQQAQQLLDLGFKLGIGGAMTYARARHLQTLATTLPLSAWVLETDAPDMRPSWLEKNMRNTPRELQKIAQFLAQLRHTELAEIHTQTSQNAHQALPKLAQLCTRLEVIL